MLKYIIGDRMKKIFAVIVFLLAMTNINALEIDSKNYVLYNLSDNILVMDQNKDEETAIASLTKIMTTIVAIEQIKDMEKKITIKSEWFYNLEEENAYVINLKEGDVVTYKDLVYGTFISSGADATRALTINLAGSEAKFVELMNDKAKELNLKKTHFDNPVGLDAENQLSTVDEVAIILKYALTNPVFKEVFKTNEYSFTHIDKKIKSSLLSSSNLYNLDTSMIVGSKTGYTYDAGRCLASVAYDAENKIEYMLVTTKADTTKVRAKHVEDSINIYNYAFEEYKYHELLSDHQIIGTKKVQHATIKEYNYKASNGVYLFHDKSFDNNKIKIKIDSNTYLTPTIKKGSKIGTASIFYDNKIIQEVDLFLEDELKYTFLGYIIDKKIYLAFIGILLIPIILTTGTKKSTKKKTLKA